jgi:hypothetical protein
MSKTRGMKAKKCKLVASDAVVDLPYPARSTISEHLSRRGAGLERGERLTLGY